MQLGELQQHLASFRTRNATVVGISVDAPADGVTMIRRLDLEFDLLSDPQLQVIRRFGLENLELGELALHATYIIGSDKRVLYRKVVRRRPQSEELLAAIDFDNGFTPPEPVEIDAKPPAWRGWSLLDAIDLGLAATPPGPQLGPGELAELEQIFEDLTHAQEDPALRKWRDYCRAHISVDNARSIMQSGEWIMRRAYLDDLDLKQAHAELRARWAELDRVRKLAGATEAQNKDARTRVQAAADRLGRMTQGPLRSLWDYKSVLKAMQELHAAELRRVR